MLITPLLFLLKYINCRLLQVTAAGFTDAIFYPSVWILADIIQPNAYQMDVENTSLGKTGVCDARDLKTPENHFRNISHKYSKSE